MNFVSTIHFFNKNKNQRTKLLTYLIRRLLDFMIFLILLFAPRCIAVRGEDRGLTVNFRNVQVDRANCSKLKLRYFSIKTRKETSTNMHQYEENLLMHTDLRNKTAFHFAMCIIYFHFSVNEAEIYILFNMLQI
jgi:hypothetical protein